MSMTDVRAALAKAFIDGSFFDYQDIGWENVSFTPRAGNKPWALWTFMPTNPVVDTLGQGGLDMMDGLVQIDLNYPMGNGDGAAMAKYVAISAVFKAGARFTYSGQVVIIRSCGRTQGRLFNGYYRISVSIVFYAQIQR